MTTENRDRWLAQLYEENYRQVYRLAVYRLRQGSGRIEEAEDVVQEVFCRAIQHEVWQHENPVGWLIVATNNVCSEMYIPTIPLKLQRSFQPRRFAAQGSKRRFSGVSAPNPAQMISRVFSALFPRRLFMASLLLMLSLLPSGVTLSAYYFVWIEQLPSIKISLRQGVGKRPPQTDVHLSTCPPRPSQSGILHTLTPFTISGMAPMRRRAR